MWLTVCKAKIAHAVVTEAQLHYEGSITIDADVIRAAGILPWEKVEVLNLNNGSRIETYVIEGPSGSGRVCLNGPAARSGLPGDTIIVLSYALIDAAEAEGFQPKIVHLDADNRIRR